MPPCLGASVANPGSVLFLDVGLGYEIVARYLSADFPGRDRGLFYYAGVWLGDGLPWSLFLVPALLSLNCARDCQRLCVS